MIAGLYSPVALNQCGLWGLGREFNPQNDLGGKVNPLEKLKKGSNSPPPMTVST